MAVTRASATPVAGGGFAALRRAALPAQVGVLAPERFRVSDWMQVAAWSVATVLLYALASSRAETEPRLVLTVLLGITLIGIYVDARKDLRAVFRARSLVLVFAFYLVLLNVVQNKEDVAVLPIDTQLWAAARYCLFVSLWLLAYSAFRGSSRFGNAVARRLPPIPGRAVFVAIVVIFCAEVIRRFFVVGWSISAFVEDALAARSGLGSSGRGRFGDWRVFIEPLSWLFHYIPPLTAFAWDKVRGTFARIVMVACSLLVLLTLFLGGSRGIFVIPIITALIYRLFVSRPRHRTTWVALMVVSAFVVAPLMDLMLRYRSTGWQAQPIVIQGVARNPVAAERDTNFSAMARMMTVVEAQGGRSAAEFYYFMLISPVPRVLWPDKPYMSQEYLGDYREEYASMSSVGDMYLYGGIVHVVLGALVFGWAVRSLDRFLGRATERPEWLLVFLLAAWVLMLSLRAIWAFVVHTESLVVVLAVLVLMGRRHLRRARRAADWAAGRPQASVT